MNYGDLRNVHPGWAESNPNLTFNKHLGKVKITEVFQIEIVKKDNNYYFKSDRFVWGEVLCMNGHIDVAFELSDFAKADGFKSAEEMFAYFDKNYSLGIPRKFWVYRWEYVRG